MTGGRYQEQTRPAPRGIAFPALRFRAPSAQGTIRDRAPAAWFDSALHDVDGGCHLGVTVEDDPVADPLDTEGRYPYFDPGEVVPL